MIISLSKFCKDTGLAKTSVYRRCQELGLDVSNGLTEDQVSLLSSEFDVSSAASNAAPQVTVEQGNHRQSLALSAPNRFNLEQFRSDRIHQALANPSEFMQGINAMVDGLSAAMEAAEHQQETELNNTRHIKRVAAQRLDSIKRRAETYRLKTDLVAMLQNTEMGELQDIAAELQEMQNPAPLEE